MDPPYAPQHAYSHRQHSPTRATTQEFLVFIRHPKPQLKRCHSGPQLKECHVLNPYPEPQLKGYVRSHNSRNLASRPSRYHQSFVDHAHPKQTKLMPLHHCLALIQSRHAKLTSRPSGRATLTAKRHTFQYSTSFVAIA